MAKKNTKNTDQTTALPATRRRAPAAKKSGAPSGRRQGSEAAAAPIDISGVSATEPIATAPDTGADASASTNGGPTHDEIAEAAYYRHLNRGGHEGGEFDDWIEAERELRERRRR